MIRKCKDRYNRSKFYLVWLFILNFLVSTSIIGIMVWSISHLLIVVPPISFTTATEIGSIIAAFDTLYNVFDRKYFT